MYQLLIRLLAPLIFIALVKDAVKRKGGFRFLKQRLGFGYKSISGTRPYWIHCASVGEVNAVLPLIKQLQSQPGPAPILVTTNTPTGAQFLNQHLSGINHVYCPVDWTYAIKAFLKHYSPQNLWVVETEIWPNLYRQCSKANISINIINARLSQKTLNAPNWLKNAYKHAFKHVNKILARSNTDAERFLFLGAENEQVKTIGNLKYAQVNELQNHPRPIERDYVLMASTHANEEFEFVSRWLSTKATRALNPLLVIVPRHPKRMTEIKTQLCQLNTHIAVDSLNQTPDDETEVFIFDRIGQLQPLYEHAQVVIMGGSFVNRGGHNLIEPSSYAKAVITGPYMQNFADETAELLANNGMIQCADYNSLSEHVKSLLNDPEKRRTLGQNARKTVYTHRDVLQDYLQNLIG